MQAALDEGDTERAVELLVAAHRQRDDPAFLYMAAELRRKTGRCDLAIGLYEQFLSTDPPEQDAEAAAVALKDCEPQRAEDGATADSEPPPPVPVDPPATDVAPTPRVPAEPHVDWYRDRWGAGLLGSGLGLTIAGGVMVGVARSNARDLESELMYRDYVDGARRARAIHRTGIALLAVGAGALVAAVVRYAVVARRRSRAGEQARR